jgi:5-methyltetrahydropteroyltriglutamate--homocysteine methyltransferase
MIAAVPTVATLATATLGFPRIGAKRELKRALEAYWSGKLDDVTFERSVGEIRRARWLRQKHHGVAVVPSNDFSLYDHVLDTCCLVGAVPPRFRHGGGPVNRTTYFRLARGGDGVAALEMTKWFDTNYHYLVPELDATTQFTADVTKPVAEFREALALGITTRPVLVGPLTFLLLAKRTDGGDPLALLPSLLPVYGEVLRALADVGATWLQIDEPCLTTDLNEATRSAYLRAYRYLSTVDPRLRLLVATYFGALGDNLSTACALPVHGLHVDLVRAPEQLPAVLDTLPQDRLLSLGVVDGRNVWRTDLDRTIALVRSALARERSGPLQVAASCSLLHVPVDLSEERHLDQPVSGWLAFAVQKLDELRAIAAGAERGDTAIAETLSLSRRVRDERAKSPLAVTAAVRARSAAFTPADVQRHSPYHQRAIAQQDRLHLPPLPTTTIGSFPQTAAVREARAAHRSGTLDDAAYQDFLRHETTCCLRRQEDLGLDVLVHGEFERTDMVEHFGELLDGFVFTSNGWVQSYGSRCVKPPIIVGDVSRPQPMTVEWARYAQAQTIKPVKGMLTGPVTILQWSFVRDDLSRDQVCRQIALALRDEVQDLEAAGIAIIQVDEPALREGLPLRREAWATYLKWAAECFRLATAGVRDDTQIHTHMCYSEFNDIIAAIADLDADVISIETARSRMELLTAFERFHYPNEVGPGVYDIHSPAVPEVGAMADLLRRACRTLKPEQVWVNPDCGLKTRGWPEVDAALRNLVAAARTVRAEITASTTR